MTNEGTQVRRWPLLVSFVLFLALCASLAAWTVQWSKPAPRPVAAAPTTEPAVTVQLASASSLFGARKPTAPATANYALKGVIVAPTTDHGMAIIAVDGKPAQALRVGADVVPGVSVKEVHPQFVLLSERGADRRVELFEKRTGEKMLAQADAQPRAGAGETSTPAAKPSVSSEAPAPERQPRSRRARAESGRTGPE